MTPLPTKIESIDQLEEIRARYLAGEEIPDELIQQAMQFARISQIISGRKAAQATAGSTAQGAKGAKKPSAAEVADLLGI